MKTLCPEFFLVGHEQVFIMAERLCRVFLQPIVCNYFTYIVGCNAITHWEPTELLIG